jgi:hypothetical protein
LANSPKIRRQPVNKIEELVVLVARDLFFASAHWGLPMLSFFDWLSDSQ